MSAVKSFPMQLLQPTFHAFFSAAQLWVNFRIPVERRFMKYSSCVNIVFVGGWQTFYVVQENMNFHYISINIFNKDSNQIHTNLGFIYPPNSNTTRKQVIPLIIPNYKLS